VVRGGRWRRKRGRDDGENSAAIGLLKNKPHAHTHEEHASVSDDGSESKAEFVAMDVADGPAVVTGDDITLPSPVSPSLKNGEGPKRLGRLFFPCVC
jgi:hypothetical protein